MKSENMLKAHDAFVSFEKLLRAAHTDAIESEDKFAEILIWNTLEEIVSVDWRLKRMREAAK